MKEFKSAVVEIDETPDGEPGHGAETKRVPFKVDDRELHAAYPTDGQLVFMLASTGRGQEDNDRFAAIVNVVLSTLRGEDKDYLEKRLLDSDPKTRLELPLLEEIFEYLVEEWYDRPTEESSDSTGSPQPDGLN